MCYLCTLQDADVFTLVRASNDQSQGKGIRIKREKLPIM